MKLGSRPSWRLLQVVLALAVCAAYANHFHNAFHFDDYHAIVENPYIRDLSNLPKFFTDAKTFSVLPANRTYRPLVSASLAFDYALGRGYNVFWFHFSTFLFFLLQLGAMYVFFHCVLNAAMPQAAAGHGYASLMAVAWYGLHPAIAETVNYIIQRGDIYSTLGVVAGLAIYARMPRWRTAGLYLLPLAFGLLSKPPAVVFPLLLFLYIVFFEPRGEPHLRERATTPLKPTEGLHGAPSDRYKEAVLATLPSIALCSALMALQAVMTPKTFVPSTVSEVSYLMTQPWVLLRYFGSFFLPLHLNVDTDLQPFTSVHARALAGFAFLACLALTVWRTARHRRLRPIAFGLLWFLIASLPTSLYRLAEVENDHRMYLPFVGLVLAVVWAAWLAVEWAARGRHRCAVLRWSAAAALIVLALYGHGVYLRNRVWRSEASLWLDDIEKCPHNGRGLMSYGLTQLSSGNYETALDCFERALRYTPNYPTLELNLGVANAALHRDPLADAHFRRALLLAPGDDQAHFFYGRWLCQNGRLAQGIGQLAWAVRLNPERLESQDQLAIAYVQGGDLAAARMTAQAALKLAAGDREARAVLSKVAAPTADDWINASLQQYQNRDYRACIAEAQQALQLKPDSELAYNNMGAAYAGLGQWDLAIASERQSLRIKPDFAVARHNLALYTEESGRGLAPSLNRETAEEWLNASLHDYQAGEYPKSIADAQKALRLRRDYAEAYNNIAASYASMRQWDKAIEAARTALRLKPDFQLTRNNLAWALSGKAGESNVSLQ